MTIPKHGDNKGHDTRALQPIWATRTSSTRSATPGCRRRGLKTSGAS